MEKSPEAFRTIREVADGLDLPQHVLRFWETRFPQIRPLKRAGGRRYYRPDDIERLRLVRRLLYDEGYTIKGVQKLFKERGLQVLADAASFDARRLLEPQETPEPSETRIRAEAPGSAQTAPRGDSMSPRVAADELATLREALAQIGEAQRLLAQARSQGS
jgi:DNA-binding transcriptional MerR regulator